MFIMIFVISFDSCEFIVICVVGVSLLVVDIVMVRLLCVVGVVEYCVGFLLLKYCVSIRYSRIMLMMIVFYFRYCLVGFCGFMFRKLLICVLVI